MSDPSTPWQSYDPLGQAAPQSPYLGYPAETTPPGFHNPPPPPPTKTSFWSATGGTLAIVGIALGSVGLVVAAFGVVPTIGHRPDATNSMDVKMVSCEYTDGPPPTAHIEYTVKNNGSSTRSATIHFEYRDTAGNRVDTDTANVRSIKPGDTVRSKGVTVLNAEASGGTCAIVGVD